MRNVIDLVLVTALVLTLAFLAAVPAAAQEPPRAPEKRTVYLVTEEQLAAIAAELESRRKTVEKLAEEIRRLRESCTAGNRGL